MARYRALCDMDRGIGTKISRGAIDTFDWLSEEDKEKLIRLGKIAKIQPPPLKILPKWGSKAERLATIGIHNAEELLDADAVEVAKRLKLTTPTVRKWQKDVEDWMRGPSSPSG